MQPNLDHLSFKETAPQYTANKLAPMKEGWNHEGGFPRKDPKPMWDKF